MNTFHSLLLSKKEIDDIMRDFDLNKILFEDNGAGDVFEIDQVFVSYKYLGGLFIGSLVFSLGLWLGTPGGLMLSMLAMFIASHSLYRLLVDFKIKRMTVRRNDLHQSDQSHDPLSKRMLFMHDPS